jgi:hypothetical protein
MAKKIKEFFEFNNDNKTCEDSLAMKSKDIEKITNHIMKKMIEDLRRGCSGEISYDDSPYWEAIDTVYREYEIHGCYMCDRDIDPNAIPFDFPDTTKLCMTCMMKLANILKSFGIDPHSLFPNIGARKIQPVIYKEVVQLLAPSEN